MEFAQFTQTLMEEGRVSVPPFASLAEEEMDSAHRFLVEFEREYRLELPLSPPDVSWPALCWAGTRFLRACQFAVYRDIGQEEVDGELGQPCPDSSSTNAHYSVDLYFRFLPQLVKFARSAAETDVLTDNLLRYAREWPLSSVGIPGVVEISTDPFLSNECLLRLYVDRILSTQDTSRLDDVRVRNAVRSALGAFPILVPSISERINDLDTKEVKEVTE